MNEIETLNSGENHMSCKVDIKGNRLIVEQFETSNKEIVSYFSDIPKALRSERFETVLLAGAVAFRTMGTTEKIDYIEKAFNNFHKEFDDKINDTFGENGKIIKDVFDPNIEGTPLCCLKNEMVKVMEEIREKLGDRRIEKEFIERTPIKGYNFEDFCEQVFSDIVKMQDGDELERTTDKNGLIERSKKGDFVIKIGKTNTKIVFETKDVGAIHLPEIHRSLEESIKNRDSSYGVFIIRNVLSLPKSVGWFKEYYGNHLVCALGTKDNEEFIAAEMLHVAFSWAKSRLMAKEGIEVKTDIIPFVREKMPQIQDSLNNFRTIRAQCTSLEKATKKIRNTSDEIESEIKRQLIDVETEINNALGASDED